MMRDFELWPAIDLKDGTCVRLLRGDMDQATETSSEIIAATADGNTLIYSDSPLGAIGFVDISDAQNPKAGGVVKLEGEPTSVVVSGNKALAGINTSQSYTAPSGRLAVIDIAGREAEMTCELAGQPDSLALSKVKIGFFTIVMAFTNAANKKMIVKKTKVNKAADELTAVKCVILIANC